MLTLPAKLAWRTNECNDRSAARDNFTRFSFAKVAASFHDAKGGAKQMVKFLRRVASFEEEQMIEI